MLSYCTLKGTDEGLSIWQSFLFLFPSSTVLSAVKAVIKSPLNAVFIKQPFPCRDDIYTFPVDLKAVFFVIGYNQ